MENPVNDVSFALFPLSFLDSVSRSRLPSFAHVYWLLPSLASLSNNRFQSQSSFT